MNYSSIKDQVQSLLNCANMRKQDTKLVIISTTEETGGSQDYNIHSVSTSYLSRQELEELVRGGRKFCSYVKVYTDIEAFLRDYYSEKICFKPTLVLETSAKGNGRGRDALVPTLCDILGYPHIGADATSSIVCSSKYQWTSALRGNCISVPDSYLFINGHWVNSPPRGKKYILKLNNECASIGLSADSVMINDGVNITHRAAQLQENYSQPVIAQVFIEGYEVEVPVLINHKFQIALPPVGLSTDNGKYYKDEFFDYDSIYFNEYGFYSFDEIMPETSIALQNCAKRIIDVLDLSGYMRIDFRVNTDGQFYIFDINNDPCITSHGSFRKSLEVLGIDPNEIIGVIIGNRLI